MDSELLRIFSQTSEDSIQNIDMDTNLFDAGLDSVKFIKLLVAVEEFYEIEFDPECLSIFIMSTLGDIKKQIEKAKAQTA